MKAAAIDVVAEDALARGRRVVLAANDVVGAGLDEALLDLAPARVAQPDEPAALRRAAAARRAGGLPYSKGLMARALVAAGVSIERAYELAPRIELDLAERRERTIDLERLEELACEVLGRARGRAGGRAAAALADAAGARPADLLLVGGATGTGKSTVATEAAHRLGITRVTSTDFIRQTMRAFFSEAFMPSIHYSSFEAGEAVVDAETGDPTVAGFLEQTRNVLVGVDAAIQRALDRGLVDGARGRPPRARHGPGARSTACSSSTSCSRSRARTHRPTSTSATSRPAASARWTSTSTGSTRSGPSRRIIVERAIRAGVPVIESSNVERTIAELMELVLLAADRVRQTA